MERIVKFRGKSKRTGEWLYGDLEYNKKKGIARIHTYTPDGEYEGQEIVDEETVGQFTGLLDKNGKEIYEGDIVRFDNTTYIAHGNKYEGNVMMYRGAYCVRYNENWCDKDFFAPLFADDFADRKTVILGNVYDNKDLLKRNKNHED